MTEQPEAKSDTPQGKTTPLEQPAGALKMADLSKSSGDAETQTSKPQPSDPQPSASNPPPAKNDDKQDTAIGEASDDVGKAGSSVPRGEGPPVCVITLLVPSGKKHPYKIDEKYLAKRNVNIPGTTASGHKDPFSISAYTLKELILREWRDDWEPAPPSPTSIRLIHFGHLLEDKKSLTG